MIGGLDATEVGEARRLTRLLDELVAEASRKADAPGLFRRAIAFAFVWVLPMCAPLLAWRGEIGLAFAVVVIGVALPAAFRSGLRTARDEALRLYGPRGEAVWLARLMAQLPWLAWASLACAAVPIARVSGAGQRIDAFAVSVSALLAALPFVRLRLGAAADAASGLRKPLESLAPFVFAVVLVRVHSKWDPHAPGTVDSELWSLVLVALVWTALASASRLMRRLGPTPLCDEEEADGGGATAGRSVELGLPSVHSPVRTAVGRELILARLSFAARLQAAAGAPQRLLLVLGALSRGLLPVLLGTLCVMLLRDWEPTVSEPRTAGGVLGVPAEPRVSLLALWLGAVLLRRSRPLREDDWVRGMNWRTQLGLAWLRSLALAFAPAAVGCAIGLAIEDAWVPSLAIAALLLSGSLLRAALGGLQHLRPNRHSGTWRTRWIGYSFVLAAMAFFFGLPVAHLLDVDLTPERAFWIAGGVAALALLGAASDALLRTEQVLAAQQASANEDLEDEEDDR